MQEQLEWIKFKQKRNVNYKLYYSRKCDQFNFISIVDKFFLDTLQELGCIEDDSCDYVNHTLSTPEKVKKINERVEITITLL